MVYYNMAKKKYRSKKTMKRSKKTMKRSKKTMKRSKKTMKSPKKTIKRSKKTMKRSKKTMKRSKNIMKKNKIGGWRGQRRQEAEMADLQRKLREEAEMDDPTLAGMDQRAVGEKLMELHELNQKRLARKTDSRTGDSGLTPEEQELKEKLLARSRQLMWE